MRWLSSNMPTKVKYRFDHIIGEAEMEIRDAGELEANTNFGAVEFDHVRRDDEFFTGDFGFTQTDENGEALEDTSVYEQEEDSYVDDYTGEAEE